MGYLSLLDYEVRWNLGNLWPYMNWIAQLACQMDLSLIVLIMICFNTALLLGSIRMLFIVLNSVLCNLMTGALTYRPSLEIRPRPKNS